MRIKYLDVAHIEETVWKLTKRFFDKSDEPIPNFASCDLSRLEQALASPRQSWDGKDLYPNIEDKAAILIYNLIKMHPFENGNKRIALVSMLVFLMFNNYWLKFENDDEAVYFTESIAASEARMYSQVCSETAEFIGINLIRSSDIR